MNNIIKNSLIVLTSCSLSLFLFYAIDSIKESEDQVVGISAVEIRHTQPEAFTNTVRFGVKGINSTNGLTDGGVANNSLSNMPGKSIKGNATASSAVPQDLIPSSSNLYLRSSPDGTTLVFTNFGSGPNPLVTSVPESNIYVTNGFLLGSVAEGPTRWPQQFVYVYSRVTNGLIGGVSLYISGSTTFDSSSPLIGMCQAVGLNNSEVFTISVVIPSGVYWKCVTNSTPGPSTINYGGAYIWPFF